jgi:putative ABC transport system substrate-binding protein
MRRREFIAGLGGSAAAWPLATQAQQRATPVIGILHSRSPEGYAPTVTAFRQGLKDAGHIDRDNVPIEFGWAAGNYDQLSAMAADPFIGKWP